MTRRAVTIGELPNTPNWRDVAVFVSAEAKELDMVLQFESVSSCRATPPISSSSP